MFVRLRQDLPFQLQRCHESLPVSDDIQTLTSPSHLGSARQRGAPFPAGSVPVISLPSGTNAIKRMFSVEPDHPYGNDHLLDYSHGHRHQGRMDRTAWLGLADTKSFGTDRVIQTRLEVRCERTVG